MQQLAAGFESVASSLSSNWGGLGRSVQREAGRAAAGVTALPAALSRQQQLFRGSGLSPALAVSCGPILLVSGQLGGGAARGNRRASPLRGSPAHVRHAACMPAADENPAPPRTRSPCRSAAATAQAAAAAAPPAARAARAAAAARSALAASRCLTWRCRKRRSRRAWRPSQCSPWQTPRTSLSWWRARCGGAPRPNRLGRRTAQRARRGCKLRRHARVLPPPSAWPLPLRPPTHPPTRPTE